MSVLNLEDGMTTLVKTLDLDIDFQESGINTYKSVRTF